jgi:hypothetical protein
MLPFESATALKTLKSFPAKRSHKNAVFFIKIAFNLVGAIARRQKM